MFSELERNLRHSRVWIHYKFVLTSGGKHPPHNFRKENYSRRPLTWAHMKTATSPACAFQYILDVQSEWVKFLETLRIWSVLSTTFWSLQERWVIQKSRTGKWIVAKTRMKRLKKVPIQFWTPEMRWILHCFLMNTFIYFVEKYVYSFYMLGSHIICQLFIFWLWTCQFVTLQRDLICSITVKHCLVFSGQRISKIPS